MSSATLPAVRAFGPAVHCLLALLVLLAMPCRAAPPEVACKPGMSVSEDTEGHCCWAGQAWRNRCVGKPISCPEGMVARQTTGGRRFARHARPNAGLRR